MFVCLHILLYAFGVYCAQLMSVNNNENNKIHISTPLRHHICKKRQIFKNLLFFHTCWEKLNVYGYDVHEVLYQNYEINGPSVKGSGLRVGPIWQCSKNVINLRKSSLLSYTFEKN